MFAGEFERDKLMMIVRLTRCRHGLVRDGVITGVSRVIIAPRPSLSADRAPTVEVQTELKAPPMKTASPVERLRDAEIMPLDADPKPIEIAVKLTPSRGHFTPCSLFGLRCFL